MKKIFLSVALIAVLGTMAVGCQKEVFADGQSSVAEVGTVYTVRYAIDGVPHSETLYSEDEYSGFLARMMALARIGYRVELFSENVPQQQSSKKTVTFTTGNENEATTWSKKMMDDGYNVVITFNEKENVYVCVAYK